MTPEAATRAARLARAKGYPYAFPRRSYLYRDGSAVPLPRLEVQGRRPVIAVGSNRAPAQLARKYADWPAGTEIPVTLAWLADHDVVHSAHFASYGAIPARLAEAAGVTVEVAVIWLTELQLDRMHETEGKANYRFRRLDGVDLRLDDGRRLDSAYAYAGLRPPLTVDGGSAALAAISAHGRRLPVLAQEQAQRAARDRLAPGVDLDDFIWQTIACPTTRAERTARLIEACR